MAAAGALGASWMSAQLGGKRPLLLSATLFVVGSLLSALAGSPAALIEARALLRVAIGVAAFTAPLYLPRSPPSTSGAR